MTEPAPASQERSLSGRGPVGDVADFHSFDVVEFGAGDDAFAFVADVDEDFFRADFDDGTFDDFACSKAHIRLLQGFFHCEHNALTNRTLNQEGLEAVGLPSSIA